MRLLFTLIPAFAGKNAFPTLIHLCYFTGLSSQIATEGYWRCTGFTLVRLFELQCMCLLDTFHVFLLVLPILPALDY